jgi:hypothetical protein
MAIVCRLIILPFTADGARRSHEHGIEMETFRRDDL